MNWPQFFPKRHHARCKRTASLLGAIHRLARLRKRRSLPISFPSGRRELNMTRQATPLEPYKSCPLLPKPSNDKVSSSSFPPIAHPLGIVSADRDLQALSRSFEKPRARQASDSSFATNRWNPEQEEKEARRSANEKRKGNSARRGTMICPGSGETVDGKSFFDLGTMVGANEGGTIISNSDT